MQPHAEVRIDLRWTALVLLIHLPLTCFSNKDYMLNTEKNYMLKKQNEK